MSTSQIYGSIIHSPEWGERDHVRLVWITMLAMADYRGIVDASVPGLAHLARVTVDQCREAVDILLLRIRGDEKFPKIVVADRGWKILEPSLYRTCRTPRQDQNAKAQARWRERSKMRALRPPEGT